MTNAAEEKPVVPTMDFGAFAENWLKLNPGSAASDYTFNTGATKPGLPPKRGSMGTGPQPVMAGLKSPVGTGVFGETVPESVTWGDYDEWVAATNPAQAKSLKKVLRQAGYSSWTSALKGASFNPNVPLGDFIMSRANDNVGEVKGGAGSGGPYQTSATSVSLSSESQAAATLDQVYQQELGRTADDKEIAAFKKALNAAQMKAPSKTVTSGVTSGRNSTSQSTTTGGFDPTRFAREYAQSQEGFGERYAGITFMDALDKAITNPDSLDQMAGNL